ncbi:MAG: 50S ribosomal protein L11 methyltransferase [Candidatus Poribacteria bacterium]|jgi:ribosomal protein L11 methyltransferase|nr:50S ribosomal protein L11 methyltransferase [Candidatus Poribacteria bacterium]
MEQKSSTRSKVGVRWTQIQVKTAVESADAIANYLFENEAVGLEIQEGNDQHTLLVYFPQDDLMTLRLRNLQRFISKLPNFGLPGEGFVTIEMRAYDSQDWGDSWRAAFPPQQIGTQVIVAPTWHHTEFTDQDEAKSDNSKILIRLDPGMAFGTGHHPTTRLSLLLLSDLEFKGREVVADIGTGSGILSILAVKMGVKKVVAIDIDETALNVAEHNFVVNDVVNKTDLRHSHGLDNTSEKFHLIIANIISQVILPMIPLYPKYLRKHGKLILSGILENESQTIRKALRDNGFRCLKERKQNEWIGILAQKGS